MFCDVVHPVFATRSGVSPVGAARFFNICHILLLFVVFCFGWWLVQMVVVVMGALNPSLITAILGCSKALKYGKLFVSVQDLYETTQEGWGGPIPPTGGSFPPWPRQATLR